MSRLGKKLIGSVEEPVRFPMDDLTYEHAKDVERIWRITFKDYVAPVAESLLAAAGLLQIIMGLWWSGLVMLLIGCVFSFIFWRHFFRTKERVRKARAVQAEMLVKRAGGGGVWTSLPHMGQIDLDVASNASLLNMTVDDLRSIARMYAIPGSGRASKADLVAALSHHKDRPTILIKEREFDTTDIEPFERHM